MSVPSLSFLQAARISTTAIQKKIVIAQSEATTGRLADQSLSLGYKTENTISLRNILDQNEILIDTNKLNTATLGLTQTALQNVVDIAHNFNKTLIGSRNALNGQVVVKDAAKQALQSFMDLMNTTSEGQYIFAGINSGVAPIKDYLSTPPGAGKTAVNNSFFTEFGMSQSAPGVNGIMPAQMETFLNGNYANLFSGASWQANFSNADDINRTARIDKTLNIEVSCNANEQAFKDMSMALTAVFDLGTGSLNQGAFEKLVDKMSVIISSATQKIGNIQSRLGLIQQEIKNSTDRIKQNNVVLNAEVVRLEGVDQYEAATRVTTLTSQLEASYSITGRLSHLNLINYL